MASYSSPSSSPPPSPSRRRLKSCARRCERSCCTLATYFPLAFVYGLTTWAAWVEASIGLGSPGAKHSTGSVKASSTFAICLYVLLNTCYTVAVFTDPGSPQDAPNSRSKSTQQNGKYAVLPTTDPSLDHERNGSAVSYALPHTKPSSVQPITVSSRGSSRFCKKCHTPKPDRSHHCSTCKRCVLKMDHHCPWLATCLGLHNYKPFLLFLIYTSVFSWVCLASSGYWLWNNMFASNQYLEEFAPVNIIMLCVISGIIGLVLTGFTAWHIWLVGRGQTTIECLEKTRYLSGVRSRVERNRVDNMHASHHRADSNDLSGRVKRAGEQLLEFHANAVPGASRYEEGEEHTSPTPSVRYPPHARFDMEAPQQYHDHPAADAHAETATPAVRALRRTHQQQSQSSYEHDREADRYAEYLDDRESEKMPNAFDLGWRRNLLHMLGPNPWLWFLPICNTTGDGWRWDVSEKWVRAREEMEVRQEERLGQYASEQGGYYGDLRGGVGFDGVAEYGDDDPEVGYERDRAGAGEEYEYARSAVSMQTLNSNGGMKDRIWGGRYRKDVDRSGENGEAESFEVSSDDEEGHGHGPHDQHGPGGRGRKGVQRGWSRDWD